MPEAVSLSSAKWFQNINENKTRRTAVFLLFWTVLNLVQVSFTELTSDEGYYWFYAQHLQWGYYDHPPLVALFIKLGGLFFPGELGVRFFNVVLSTVGLWLFFSLLPEEHKQKPRTFLVLLAAPLLHYLTFLVFPDGPLLFFTVLFLVLYKRFLQKQTVANALLLGLVIALMGYSKYHGVLVLLFTVIANPKLLRNGYFYFSLAIAALAFFPHLWWQYQQGFPTLKYHLSGRTGQWSFRHVGEYISQQVVAIGPAFVFLPFVCKANDVFERTFKFIIIGTFGFFLIGSFKAFVHFHWTSVALYPLLYFGVVYYNQPQTVKWFRGLILPFVALFFVARLLLAVPLIQGMHASEDYYHGRKAWATEIAAVAGNRPVFMPNNLREASLYSFYSGKLGVTLYNRPEKKSQYELWGYEDSLQGKDVLLVAKSAFSGSDSIKTSIGKKTFYAALPLFQSYYTGITINESLQNFKPTDSVLRATLTVINERQRPISFQKSFSETPLLIYSIEKDNRVVRNGTLQSFFPFDELSPNEKFEKTVSVPVAGLPKGQYQIFFGIKNGVLPDAILSRGESFRKG